MFTTALFMIAHVREKAKCLSMMKAENVMYVGNGILCKCLKIKKILLFLTTWINLEGIMLIKMSDRQRKILCDITYI